MRVNKEDIIYEVIKNVINKDVYGSEREKTLILHTQIKWKSEFDLR